MFWDSSPLSMTYQSGDWEIRKKKEKIRVAEVVYQSNGWEINLLLNAKGKIALMCDCGRLRLDHISPCHYVSGTKWSEESKTKSG